MSELLNNVRMASPCTADWDKMIGDGRVRHCSQCKLNVYNLSSMSSIEAQDLVAEHEGRMCVRFYHRKDGTVITRNCPVGLRVVMRRVSCIAGIALSVAMSASTVLAQSGEKAPALAVQADTGLEIHVVDAHGAACPGSTVEISDSSNVVKAIADSDGVARLTNLTPGNHVLTVTAPGLQPYQTTVWVRERVTFKLEISQEPPLIETTQAQVGVTGGAVILTPLTEPAASNEMPTFSEVSLAVGGAISAGPSPLEKTALELKVVDPAGAVGSGAKVQLRDEITQQVITATTDSDGRQRVVDLSPGTYVLTITLPGFKPFEKSVTISEGKTSVLTATLQIGVMQGVLVEPTIIPVDLTPEVEVPPLVFEPVPVPDYPLSTRRGFFRRIFDKLFHRTRS